MTRVNLVKVQCLCCVCLQFLLTQLVYYIDAMDLHQLIIETRSQKLKKITSKNINTINSNVVFDNWMHDCHIQSYFNSLNDEIIKTRNDILVIGPSLSQIIKNGSNYDVISNLTSLSFQLATYALFCVSNYDDVDSDYKKNSAKGAHWSLLFFNRHKDTIYHFDSIKGFNKACAKKLSNNINPNLKIIEMPTIQQRNNFECGVHVMVNARSIINELLKETLDFSSLIENEKQNDTKLLLETKEKYHKPSTLCHDKNSSWKDISKRKSSKQKTNIINNVATNIVHKNQFETLSVSERDQTIRNETSLASNKKETYTLDVKHPLENEDLQTEVLDKKPLDHINNNKFVKNVLPDIKGCKPTSQMKYKSKLVKNKKLKDKNKYNIIKIHQMSNENTNKSIQEKITTVRSKSRDQSEKKEDKIEIGNSNILNDQIKDIEIQDLFVKNKNKKRKLKVFADSHGRDLRSVLETTLKDDFIVSSFFKPNSKLCHIIPNAKNEGKYLDKDDFLFLMCGTNDIDEHFNINIFINTLEANLQTLANTNVLISSIPYRYDFPYLNKVIRKVNYKIQDLTNKYTFLRFLSLRELHKNDYTIQGLHLCNNGKTKLCKIIKDEILRDINYQSLIPVRITHKIDKMNNEHYYLNNFYKPDKHYKHSETKYYIGDSYYPFLYKRLDNQQPT